jgi:hypothetical protein
MATSRTDIANRALAAISADAIGSINETTTAARACNRLFTPLTYSLLRRHPWNFALARASLPASATAPAWGYAFAYPVPTDYLKIYTIDAAIPTTKFVVEGGKILTDVGAPLNIRYVRKVDDPGEFDPLFTEALVLAMARDLAMPLSNNAGLRQAMAKDMEDAIRTARSADAGEGVPDELWSDTLLNARLW